RKVAEGHKASFCLEDSSCTDRKIKVFNCDEGHQGISPGCEDTYKAAVDCQWIDVTDVPLDEYTFRVTVNPKRLVRESNFANNGIRCKVSIKRHTADIWNCSPIGV
uniref:Lysyl oxidase homolog n=1 Tax=Ciona savignyi TaxID=51511 RepID=H2ZK60_CIOSA